MIEQLPTLRVVSNVPKSIAEINERLFLAQGNLVQRAAFLMVRMDQVERERRLDLAVRKVLTREQIETAWHWDMIAFEDRRAVVTEFARLSDHVSRVRKMVAA